METHQQQAQQLPLSVTDPRPPTGDTPTMPPLTLSSTVGNPTQLDLMPKPAPFDVLSKAFYLTQFTINTTQARAAPLFTFNWKQMVATAIQGGSTINGQTPFQLTRLLFGRSFNIESLDLIFTPIKLGNSAVTVDLFFSYDDVAPAAPNTDNAYNLDHMEMTFTDMEQKRVNIPLYYLIPELLTYRFAPTTDPQGGFGVFSPKTKMGMFLKTKYIPQLIQPESFEVLVHVDIKYNSLEEFAPTSGVVSEFYNFR